MVTLVGMCSRVTRVGVSSNVTPVDMCLRSDLWVCGEKLGSGHMFRGQTCGNVFSWLIGNSFALRWCVVTLCNSLLYASYVHKPCRQSVNAGIAGRTPFANRISLGNKVYTDIDMPDAAFSINVVIQIVRGKHMMPSALHTRQMTTSQMHMYMHFDQSMPLRGEAGVAI